MAQFCSTCGGQMADGATTCPGCGKTVSTGGGAAAQMAPAASSAQMPIEENIAGALAYVTIVPPIIFLVMDPFNKNRFVRFHSFQALFGFVAGIVLGYVLKYVMLALAFIPVLGWIVDALIVVALIFGSLALWLFLLYKAYKGQMFKLPIIGNIAEQQANKI